METDELRAQAVAEAREWLGTPYHDQASLKGVGTDCLGLLRGVWRGVLGEEPETPPAYSRSWSEAGSIGEPMLEAAARHMDRLSVDDVLPGDVLVFRMRQGAVAKHCGVVVEGGRMIHSHSGRHVVEVTLGRPWMRRAVAGFRFRT